MSSLDPKRGLLAYDGDCGFCAYRVRYWRRLTGDRVRYAPYQDILAQHPEVQAETFVCAIQLFEPDGARYSVAEAAFRVLARAPGRGAGLWLYRWLLFRFMLFPGAVKLLSHGPSWAHLSALGFHYQT